MLRGEATNTIFIVFGLTRLGIEPTIYRTRSEHANHYTIMSVKSSTELMLYVVLTMPTLNKAYLLLLLLFIYYDAVEKFRN